LAVGVHTTQFAIREAGLFEEVLALAAETARDWRRPGGDDTRPLLVAGAVGRTEQAVAEARLARSVGYDAVLLSLAALKGASDDERVALYTGNDDHIVLDLVTPFDIVRDGRRVRVRFRGGLLGHWSVWTRSAVELLARCKAAAAAQDAGGPIDVELLALDSRVT